MGEKNAVIYLHKYIFNIIVLLIITWAIHFAFSMSTAIFLRLLTTYYYLQVLSQKYSIFLNIDVSIY